MIATATDASAKLDLGYANKQSQRCWTPTAAGQRHRNFIPQDWGTAASSRESLPKWQFLCKRHLIYTDAPASIALSEAPKPGVLEVHALRRRYICTNTNTCMTECVLRVPYRSSEQM